MDTKQKICDSRIPFLRWSSVFLSLLKQITKYLTKNGQKFSKPKLDE